MTKKKQSHRHKSKGHTRKERHDQDDEIVPPALPSFAPVPEFKLSKHNDTGPFMAPQRESSSDTRSSKKRDFADISDDETARSPTNENEDEPQEESVKRQRTQDSPSGEDDDWTTVTYKKTHDVTHVHRKNKKEKASKREYPEFVVSPQRLKGWVRIADLQMLALNILSDGIAPNWLLIKVHLTYLFTLRDLSSSV